MKAFSVNILGLSLKTHHFEFTLDDAFFKEYGDNLVSEGNLTAVVELTKKETFIGGHLAIKGTVRLTCDRSLEQFDEPIEVDKKIVFKYGEHDEELSDEIIVIQRDRAELDLGQYLYEFIILEVPMKKIHPRLRSDEDDEVEGKVIYTSLGEDSAEDPVDPRWEKLKKIK